MSINRVWGMQELSVLSSPFFYKSKMFFENSLLIKNITNNNKNIRNKKIIITMSKELKNKVEEISMFIKR